MDGYYLGESSQGLGYSNIIYMHLQLKEYEKKMNPLKVNVFFADPYLKDNKAGNRPH